MFANYMRIKPEGFRRRLYCSKAMDGQLWWDMTMYITYEHVLVTILCTAGFCELMKHDVNVS